VSITSIDIIYEHLDLNRNRYIVFNLNKLNNTPKEKY